MLLLLAFVAVGLSGWAWLQANPQHNPWAPLDLRDPPGFATEAKLRALFDDPAQCRAVLERSALAFTVLDPIGEGQCRRDDRTRLADFPLAPTEPTTCPVAAGLKLWFDRTVQPAAREILGSEVARVEQFGAYSCRRLYGRSEGRWSEHATANAIDIAAFVLEDGRRISVLADWPGEGDEARFLRAARDGACDHFATTLSPDYNAAHRDHFHLDQANGWRGVCL